MTPGDHTLIELNRTLRDACDGAVMLPVTLVAWLEGLARDAVALAVTYDAHALDSVARFDAGPGISPWNNSQVPPVPGAPP